MALPTTTYDIATATNPTSALTDFTFIVDLSTMSSAWWAAVDTTDGTKGRASKSDGTTELACDWIDFDSTEETGILRVKYTGTLASTGTQQIRVYPPVSANSSYGVSDTYGQYNAYDSEIECYWSNPLDLTDRTGTITLSKTGTITEVIGALGKAAQNTDTSSYLSAAETFFTGNAYTPITMTGLLKVDAPLSRYLPVVMSTAPANIGNSSYRLYSDSTTAVFAVRRYSDVKAQGGTFAADTWQSLSGVESSVDARAIFLNGSSVDTDATSIGSLTGVDTITLCLQDGIAATASYQHIMILSSAKSASWNAEETSQLLDNATFWGTWTNVPVGSSGAISGTSTGESTATGLLKGSGILTGTSDGTSDVTATIKGAGKLLGLSEGDCTVTGTLTGTSSEGNLQGNISGTSTVSGTLTATGKLSGEIAGTCVVSGTIIGKTTGELSGLSEGICTVTGNIYDTSGGAVGLITITLTASAPTLTITGSRPNINIQTGI